MGGLIGRKKEPEIPPPPPPFQWYKGLGWFLRVFWRAIFSIIWPLLWIPVLTYDFYRNDLRCLYCVCVMAGYWVTECIPSPITSIIPILYMPIMGITGTTDICKAYFTGTNVMFITSVMIALAVKHCNLHIRIALAFLLLVGCSPRRLHFGVMTITNLLSWWMQNTACTAMMCPIVYGVLEELEKQGMGPIYHVNEDEDENETPEDNLTKRVPTNNTIAFFLAAAYSSSLGGCATLVGTDTNLVYRDHLENFEQHWLLEKEGAEGVNFAKFMALNAPIMIILNCLFWLVLQILFMGLFRPNSIDYQVVQKGKELEKVARSVLKEKFNDLGRLSWHESWVLFLFIMVILLWLFRDPGLFKGWKEIGMGTEVGDAVACIFILIAMFLIPKDPTCFKSCSADRDERPTKMSEGLINWKVLHEQTPWGIMLLLGGGFAIAKAADDSKMSVLVGDWLGVLKVLPPWLIMMICATAASFFTELTANVSTANILVPIVLALARKIEVNPLFLSLPTGICCSFCFMLPVGTPPNALVAGFVNMKTSSMAKAGIILSILSLIVYFSLYLTWGGLFWNFNKISWDYPDKPKS
ncbi:protein I'm not dead yet-like [Chrysoperla carnea]|uniref:protein I'm not dead yet-like n=1 Tax=Chrysoperla carnea TaxID=189513 RepID=UPI001D0903C2|nr:protein I'm not dead yet-like [Chrysoperla carnea]